jgi:hypothetical protein
MSRVLRTSRLVTGLIAALAWAGTALAQGETSATYVVQSDTLDAARGHVRRVGAEPQRDFEIIHAVAVQLTPAQVERLRANTDVKVFDDRAIKTRGTLPGGTQNLVNDVNSTAR